MQQKISLKAQERTVLGKKVKTLRKQGIIPGNVFGNSQDSEAVSINYKDFINVYDQAGETSLVDLKIGDEKTKPVLIRNLQHHALTDDILHVDFYQVNLKEKVTVPVPIVLVGDEPEVVHMGEGIVLQNLSEVGVECLPTDLIDQIEVNISSLKQIDDAITVENLNYNRELLTILAQPEEIVVKLAPAVTEEMKALMEEQAQEAAAAQEEQATEEGAEAPAEGEEGESSDESADAGGGEESSQNDSQDKTEEKAE